MAIRRTRALIVGLVAVLASGLVSVLAGTGVAHADSALISVYSPSMDKDIPVKVLKAAGGGPAPTCTCSTVCGHRTTTTAG